MKKQFFLALTMTAVAPTLAAENGVVSCNLLATTFCDELFLDVAKDFRPALAQSAESCRHNIFEDCVEDFGNRIHQEEAEVCSYQIATGEGAVPSASRKLKFSDLAKACQVDPIRTGLF